MADGQSIRVRSRLQVITPCELPRSPLFENMTGQQRCGSTVLSFAGRGGKHFYWNVKCGECCQEFVATSDRLRHSTSSHCPVCVKQLRQETIKRYGNKLGHAPTHGMSGKSEHNIWLTMISRCGNRNHKYYDDYGGRGIAVCDRWLNSFEAFYADMGPKPTGYTIERVNNNLGYSPDNCKWATRTEQARNKRNCRMVTAFGKTQCVSAWAEEMKIPATRLEVRLWKLKWLPEVALTKPKRGAK